MKPKLLLLHGALGSSDQFDSLISLLKDNFECITYDLPGHGDQEFKGDEFSIAYFSKELLNFIVENNIQNSIVFGFSMGGYIALNTEIYFPKTFKAILTLGTKMEWSPEIAAKEIQLLDPNKIEEKVPTFAKQLATRHTAMDWKSLCIQTKNLILQLGENHLTKTDFQKINCLTQLMVGDHDSMVSIEETTSIYRFLKNATMVVIPNSIHPFEKINLNDLTYEINRFAANL